MSGSFLGIRSLSTLLGFTSSLKLLVEPKVLLSLRKDHLLGNYNFSDVKEKKSAIQVSKLK